MTRAAAFLVRVAVTSAVCAVALVWLLEKLGASQVFRYQGF